MVERGMRLILTHRGMSAVSRIKKYIVPAKRIPGIEKSLPAQLGRVWALQSWCPFALELTLDAGN